MATTDNRNSYRLKVRVSVESTTGSYSFDDVAIAERCQTAKFSFSQLEGKMTSLINSTKEELMELVDIHTKEMYEKEAILRAKEEAGESC